MDLAVPSLRRVCVLKVVEEIRQFCPGVPFEDLGKYQFIVGPFEYICKYLFIGLFHFIPVHPLWITKFHKVVLSRVPTRHLSGGSF